MKATFDGDLEKLTFFLNQVWVHIDDHAVNYPSDQAMVRAVTVNLEGEAAEWVTQLHDEDAPELGNIDTFLQELRVRFEDDSQALQSEAEICKIKQRGWPTKEYIQEFQRVAEKLQQWLERLPVHFFKGDLDCDLLHMCIYQGIFDQIHEWY